MEKIKEKQDIIAIQKTAATIVDLADNSNVPFSLKIKEILIEKIGIIQSFAPTMAPVVVSRYLTNHKMLEKVAKLTNGRFQIIELGSGFTPHALNLGSFVAKYIEIDLPENIRLKKSIVKKINPKDKTTYISGNVLNKTVWKRVYAVIDTTLPVVIFSEGFIIYFSNKEQEELLSYILPIIKPDDISKFVFDDSLKYHPELQTHPALFQGKKDVINSSKSKNFNETLSQEIMINNFKKRGFSKIKRTPYVIAGKELEDIMGEYKLFECYR